MRVKIIEINQTTGEETPSPYGDGTADIFECFPNDEETEERREAMDALQKVGRYYVGGGAAPLVLLMIVR